MLKQITTLTLVLALSACAATPKNSTTPSGSPEALINKPVDTVKPALIAHMLESGYALESETKYQIKFNRQPSPGEGLIIGLFVGNGYSTNKMVIEDTLIPTGSTTRIIGKSFYWAQFPFGRIDQKPADENVESYNRHQTELNAVKSKLN